MFDDIIENISLNTNNFIKNIKKTDVCKIVDIIYKYKNNNIFFSGIGKSGNIALHISDVLKSIGLKSFYLNLTNSTHGDLGCVYDKDLIFIFSNSGNTKEILDVIDNFKCKKILICSNKNAKLKAYVDNIFLVPLDREGDLHYGLIPTNSVVNNILYFNIIVNMYINKIGLKKIEYKLNHPSGNIGFKTKRICDFLSNDIYICEDIFISLEETIKILKKNKMGIVFLNNKKFYGILTTKDILNIYGIDKKMNINKYININPIIFDDENELIINKIEELKKYKYFKFIPVINNNKFIGILDNSKLLKYI